MVITRTRPAFIAMFLFSITVGLYYRSLMEVFFSQSVLTIDDSTLMQHLSNHKMQFYEIFNSGWQKKYFRPFIDFSYLVDQRLWGDSPFGFRSTNVLVHSLNVVFLYFTARTLLKFKKGGDEASFLAAILFAVHPIAVESVSWISGRSDSMATFWSMLAILFYLFAKDRHRLYLIPSSLFAFLAILSKEVAIAVPLVIGLFEFFYCQSFGYRRSRYALAGFVLFLIVIPLYML
ncbi:glycosyltransferase family 39 protein, partial [bacterium]|nr:glycosyltransferase family 39 protein [bacterium]